MITLRYIVVNVTKVGNKIDLPKREVTTSEAEEFARDNNCFYMETSALDGTGVNQAFYQGKGPQSFAEDISNFIG